MTVPSAELSLQKAVVAALKSSADLAGLSVYDHVPPKASTPYVNIRTVEAVSAAADGVEAWDVHLDLDLWSDKVGRPTIVGLAAAVRAALDPDRLTLADPYALVDLTHTLTNVDEDDDTNLSRARLSFTALVDGP